MAKTPAAQAPSGPAVALVTAARTVADPTLTGNARRRAEQAAARQLPKKKVKALRKQLQAASETAAELGLQLQIDREALDGLAAAHPDPEWEPAHPFAPAQSPQEQVAPAAPAARQSASGRTPPQAPVEELPAAASSARRPAASPDTTGDATASSALAATTASRRRSRPATAGAGAGEQSNGRETAARRTPARKTAARKTAARKTPDRKTPARKTAARTSSGDGPPAGTGSRTTAARTGRRQPAR